MKTFLLLLLLLPFTALAKFYKGEITFNNGTTKPGYVEIPDTHDQKKIRFRATEDGDTEKFTVEEVKSFYVEDAGDNNDLTFYYITCKLADDTFLGKGFTVNKRKSWVRLENTGTINIVSAYYSSTGASGFSYYVHFPKENVAKYLAVFYGGGLTLGIGEFAELKRQTEKIFKGKCNDVVNNLTKEAFKEKGLKVIIELYEQYCPEKPKKTKTKSPD